MIRPALEVGVDATDNAAGTARKRAAVGLVVAPEINIQAQDKRYAVEANLHGEAVLYGDKELDERAADARIKGHYDLTANTTLQGEVGYSYYLDRYNDPNTPAAAVERPPVHQFDAKLGATQRFGAFGLGVDGEMQREVHEDVALAGGGTASLSDLDNTEYGLRLRASYGLGRPLTPYVEAAGGRRDYDEFARFAASPAPACGENFAAAWRSISARSSTATSPSAGVTRRPRTIGSATSTR